MSTDQFRWHSKTIAADLKKFENVKSVKIIRPGGDFDTQNIIVTVNKGDTIYISAYQYDHSNPPSSTSEINVHYVCIEDGLDSRGGLNSTKKTTALVFVEIRQYFIDKNASIIEHYDEIF